MLPLEWEVWLELLEDSSAVVDFPVSFASKPDMLMCWGRVGRRRRREE